MKIKKIEMPEWANYISEFMPGGLPTGIFNKKITATGATTMALENKQDIILLCPDNGLIDNKMDQYPNERCNYEFLKINCDVSDDEIMKYVNHCKGKQPVKLLCTYDSLHKLLKIENVYNDYHLIVDEFHELLNLTNERQSKGIIILDKFKKFRKYTFISATPIKDAFLPEALNNVDYYELVIPNSEKIKVIGQQTNKPFSHIVDIIKNFKIEGEIVINGRSCKHLYIYINSVTAIANIIKNSCLTQNDVNIFCGDYPFNDLKLEKVGCEIGKLLTKKQLEVHPEFEPSFHFISSKGFKGCDIYSNDGLAIYVTNYQIKSTISGMETLQQISGRIRTKSNPFNGILYHIYNINKAELSYEEYLKEQEIQINASKEIINDWEYISEGSKASIVRDWQNTEDDDTVFYHYYDDNIMKLNDLKIKADQSKHIVENLIYTEGIEVRKAYSDQGFEDHTKEYLNAESTFHNFIKHLSFKDYCINYNRYLEAKFYIGEPLFGCNEKTKKLIMKAFNILGYSKIRQLKYHQTSIKENLADANSFNRYGIMKAAHKRFKVGEIYSKSDLKAAIQSIYVNLKCKKTAKSTDINNYFECKECKLANGNKGIRLEKGINTIFQNQVTPFISGSIEVKAA